jgi:type IV pilus assembly protein PilQ
MSNKQGGVMLNKMGKYLLTYVCFGLFLSVAHIIPVEASDLSLSNVGVVALADNKLQIQLEISGGVATLPKVFQTDNPARIALDFSGVKNTLDKKMYPINQGSVSNVYVASSADRIRVVINLLESTPFETKVLGNKILLTLSPSKPVVSASTVQKNLPVPASAIPTVPAGRGNPNKSVIPALMPEQAISGFDFKRGTKGEGRILISLANPNTIVNTKEQTGKVILSFVNTRLPSNLSKRLDVSEFATPVKFIDAISSGKETTLSVTLQNNLYEYSSFQSNGLLTIEFRPLTEAEKQTIEKTKAKFSGDRLSLNFQEIEVRSVIAILAEFTGQNVVAGDDVTGNITLKLDDVPWDEALAFIMMTKDLGKYETGNVTLITPLDRLKTYKEKERDTAAVVAALDPLSTEYIKINYASAGAIVSLLYGSSAGANTCTATATPSTVTIPTSATAAATAATSSSTTSSASTGGTNGATGAATDSNTVGLGSVSARGSVAVDQRTNTLIVRDTAKRLEEIRDLIHKLDVPVRQVMIESRIVVATNNFVKELGVKFGTAKTGGLNAANKITSSTTDPVTGVVTNTTVPNPNNTLFGIGGSGTMGSAGGATGPAVVALQDQLVNLATSGTPMGALGMTLARGADYVLNLELQALQSQGKGELISNPRVMTSDRCQATVKQGVKIPYSSAGVVAPGAGAATSTVIFVDAVLELDVTPQITPNGSVIMKLNITNNSPGATTPNGLIGIDSREIHTNVHVLDGETVVLGGVFQETITDSLNSVPFFADLPGIGFLFKNTKKQDNKTELLIFITPKIVKDNAASDG